MAISLTVSATTTDQTSHLVSMPATVAASDLLLVALVTRTDTAITNPGGGWNQLHTTANGTTTRLGCYYKIAAGSEDGTTVDFVSAVATESVSHTFGVPVAEWHGTTPPEVGTAATGSDINPDPPNLTPSWGSEATIWIAVEGVANIRTVTTYPTNYTDGADDDSTAGGNNVAIGSARRTLTASSENPGTFTLNSTGVWVAQTIAIRPAASGTPHTRTIASIVVSNLVDS